MVEGFGVSGFRALLVYGFSAWSGWVQDVGGRIPGYPEGPRTLLLWN